MKKMPAALLGPLLALTACGSPAVPSPASPGAAASPRAPGAGDGFSFTIACETEAGELTFRGWAEAWASPKARGFQFCAAQIASGATPSPEQADAIQRAGFEDPAEITVLAELCADPANEFVLASGGYADADNGDPDGSEAVSIAEAMLMLCPDFPEAKVVRERIAETRSGITPAPREDSAEA